MSAELRSRSKKKKAKDERGRPESIDLSGTDHALPKNVHLQAQGDGQYKILAPGTPWDEIDLSEVPFLEHLKHQHPPKWFWQKSRFLFPLGLLLGGVLAFVLVSPIDPNALDAHLHQLSLRLSDLSLPDLAFPDFPDLNALPQDLLARFNANTESAWEWMKSTDFQAGVGLKNEGLEAKHPVILVPGIVSTGLESWSTSPDARPWFRKRLWGSTSMVRAVLTDKEKWVKALSLDPVTGLDPEGHKVRAAQGFDAASQFIQGYWVWAKIIENLAPLNYDVNNLELAAYDWRLSYWNLEERDGYFSQLKSRIEYFRSKSGEKVVLVGHSMGATIIVYFMKWVEAEGPHFGNGGPTWVEDNLEAFVNIAGPLLGVAKAMSAFLSGEMRDTVEVNPAASYMLEKMFSRKERADLFRGWGGSASMWLKGGDAIWGDERSAPDDPKNATDTHGRFISFRDMNAPHEAGDLQESDIAPNLTLSAAADFVLEHTPPTFQKMFGTNYSDGFENRVDRLKRNGQDQTKWTNPLEFQLPMAPSMKIYCMYGHGKETERSYWYVKGKYEQGDSNSEGDQVYAGDLIDNSTLSSHHAVHPRNPLNFPLSRDLWIDSLVNLPSAVPAIRSGVKFGEGDGTVPLLSLGAMCVEGWKREEWNPAGIKVVTREQNHRPEALDLRGGATTGDHIDILGSKMVNEAVGRIAAGRGDELEDHFVSDIKRYTERMDWDRILTDDNLASVSATNVKLKLRKVWRNVVG